MTFVVHINIVRIKSKSVAPLICTLKIDFDGVTWDFLGYELEKIYSSNHPDSFRGRHPIFFLIYLMKPSFFSGCHPEKIQVEFYPIFFQGGKSTHLFKTENRVQIKGTNESWQSQNLHRLVLTSASWYYIIHHLC